MKKFKWTVEFTVDQTWVEDGFNLSTNEDAMNMLMNRLPFAYRHELKARVIKKPAARAIAIAQGYIKPRVKKSRPVKIKLAGNQVGEYQA